MIVNESFVSKIVAIDYKKINCMRLLPFLEFYSVRFMLFQVYKINDYSGMRGCLEIIFVSRAFNCKNCLRAALENYANLTWRTDYIIFSYSLSYRRSRFEYVGIVQQTK